MGKRYEQTKAAWEATTVQKEIERRTQKKSRHERAKAMREAGMTYKAIGEKLGVTRQRAMQLANYTPGDGLHAYALLAIPYKGLREWMLANRVSISELGRRCDCCVERAIKGDGCQKYTIDAILRVTGLTYEECFAEIPAEEEYY